jgi:hypothetical protein
MKKLYTILAAVLVTASIFSQSPEKMSYQAVVRDSGDNLVTSQVVGMRISILQGTTAVYVETQTPTTNVNGLVTLEIGGSSATVVSGIFADIVWSADTYFIKTETDPTGDTTYTITGTSQLMSVPYALYAKTSGNGSGPAGEDGNDGSDGANGIDGAVGADGPQGPQGNIGSSGDDGVDGNDGAQGETGAQGIQGETGAAGTNATQPIYTINTLYPELGGYVIEINTDGTHGLVVAMQDQGTATWYEANDLLSDANNHDVNGAKFKDWRLPTKRELNLMYGVYIGGNGPNLNSNYYWSSTEFDYNGAWVQYFPDGFQYNGLKNDTDYVRAVRAF